MQRTNPVQQLETSITALELKLNKLIKIMLDRFLQNQDHQDFIPIFETLKFFADNDQYSEMLKMIKDPKNLENIPKLKEIADFLEYRQNILVHLNQVKSELAQTDSIITECQEEINKQISKISSKLKEFGIKKTFNIKQISAQNLDNPNDLNNKIRERNNAVEAYRTQVNAFNDAVNEAKIIPSFIAASLYSFNSVEEANAKLTEISSHKKLLSEKLEQIKNLKKLKNELTSTGDQLMSASDILKKESDKIQNQHKVQIEAEIEKQFSNLFSQELTRISNNIAKLVLAQKNSSSEEQASRPTMPAFSTLSIKNEDGSITLSRSITENEFNEVSTTLSDIEKQIKKIKPFQKSNPETELLSQAKKSIKDYYSQNSDLTTQKQQAVEETFRRLTLYKVEGIQNISVEIKNTDLDQLEQSIQSQLETANEQEKLVLGAKEAVARAEAAAKAEAANKVEVDRLLKANLMLVNIDLLGELKGKFEEELTKYISTLVLKNKDGKPDLIKKKIYELSANYIKLSSILKECDHYQAHLQKKNPSWKQDYSAPKPELKSNEDVTIKHKQDYVAHLRKNIIDTKTDADSTLLHLKNELNRTDNRRILTANRDGAGTTFLHAVLAFFTFGLSTKIRGVSYFGESHGKAHTDRLTELLKQESAKKPSKSS